QDSIRKNKTDFISKEELYEKQKEYLRDYNKRCRIDFLDNKELDTAMKFMRFHLLQATTRDSYGNISAKGLSGEGYEGHYFWDTEIFLFPVWLLWDKKRAKNLLLYRYGLLDIARARAKEMGNSRGACFSWRTISGIESSGYFPAGSAQYHINFDIAYTFIQWWLSNYDWDFLITYSMEVLIETARTALEIGSFEKGKFHIHGVTGPDEYTALVSDNYYTNKMAQYNLSWAVKLWHKLEKERWDDWIKLKEKLSVSQGEIEKMQEAAQNMVFIYDKEKGIRVQDASFLQKAKWPKENKKRPLLLHYHPLNIYRHQIIKQADTVLGQYLLGEENEEIMRKSFYYYEEINTHDSSLSRSISGLMAARLRDEKKAYDYFMDSVYLDIEDLQENTRDGLHMANIGGSLLSVLRGFGGLTIEEEGLYINPFLPKKLGRLSFRFTWREALLEVLLEGEEVDIRKISGPKREIILRGEKIRLGEKAVLFDLDGVLTGTSDNHYEAWKKMSKELAYDLPENFRDKLRGIGRMESIDLILEDFGLSYSLEEKIRLTDRKNDYYKESIRHFGQDNLYPGVLELLRELRKRKVKIGLVSASANAKALIKSMEIEKYFDEVVDPRQIKKGKPHPDPFLAAAKGLKVLPKDCLGVEDALAGIESINAAGMTSLGIGGSDLAQADFRYKTIKEASDFIIRWVEEDYGRN
ncbi:MAG TPA: beta-phosphoglucomutase, partial [Clostridia bacterium]|nr:beta-phosphoglucomutase [Clostridia bacterium]